VFCISVELTWATPQICPIQTHFDAVFTSFTLELLIRRKFWVLAECRRVLKRQGRVCASLSKDKKLGLMGQLYERLHSRFLHIWTGPIPLRFILKREAHVVDIEQHAMWGSAGTSPP
jgi:ubiquinone/menaquinone biosynthesis C-methylase UbiE